MGSCGECRRSLRGVENLHKVFFLFFSAYNQLVVGTERCFNSFNFSCSLFYVLTCTLYKCICPFTAKIPLFAVFSKKKKKCSNPKSTQ